MLLFLAALSATTPVPLGHAQRVGHVLVTPLAVEEDSRCPRDVSCVWAGRLVVRALVVDGRRRTTRRFVLGEPVRSGIALTQVTPDRTTAGLNASAYRFRFAPAP